MNTTAKTNRNTNAETTKRTKGKWNFPVSQKFYKNLINRIEIILQALVHDSRSIAHLQSIIDAYLLKGVSPTRHELDGQHLTIFLCLKHDIDLAIERSARAKVRAAERRAQKEAAKSHTEMDKIESSTPTPIVSNEETMQNHQQIPKKTEKEKVKQKSKNQQSRLHDRSHDLRTSKRKSIRKFHKVKPGLMLFAKRLN